MDMCSPFALFSVAKAHGNVFLVFQLLVQARGSIGFVDYSLDGWSGQPSGRPALTWQGQGLRRRRCFNIQVAGHDEVVKLRTAELLQKTENIAINRFPPDSSAIIEKAGDKHGLNAGIECARV